MKTTIWGLGFVGLALYCQGFQDFTARVVVLGGFGILKGP